MSAINALKAKGCLALASVLAIVLINACAPPSPVIQGKVISVAADGRSVVMADESNQGSAPATFDISNAEIGATPAVGDELRLVYRVQGGTNVALRVMNITRQQAREASGH